MKNTRKLLVALVLVMTILMTMAMAVIPASAAKISGGTKLYLVPSSNWNQDNARFAAYFFGDGDAWVSMTKVAGESNLYEVTSPVGKNFTNVIFCRMNPSNSTNGWGSTQKWNQTADLTYNGTSNCYTVKEGTWDKGGGTWSTYGSTCAHANVGPAATCTTAQLCSDCGDPVASALGHTYNSSHLCTRCNEQAPFTVAGSGAHMGTEWAPENAANDMTYADGVYTKVYTNVAAGSYALKVARDHDWGTAYPSADKAYTVATSGSTVTVTLKGTTVTVTVEAPHVHSWSDATCTNPQKCACGETQGEALGHSYNSVVTAPTFEAKGYTTHTCENCGDSYVDSYVDALVVTAQIGDKKFESLQKALDAAVDGDTVVLLADIAVSKYLDIYTANNGETKRNFTLDLNGHVISTAADYNYNTGYPVVFVGINQTLTIKGEGTITADKKITVGVYGVLYLEGGNIVNNGTTDNDAAIASYYWNNDLPSYEGIVGGTVYLKGGNFTGVVYCDDADEDGKAVLSITGGNFTNDVSKYCAEGYECVANENGGYTVALHVHSWSDATCTEAEKCSCGETKGEALGHADADPADHECDVCGLCLSDCKDDNKNHKCDICGDTMSKCADDDKNHFCDVCGVQNSHCIDIPPYDHNCDWCGEKVSEHNYVDGVCDICGAKHPGSADSCVHEYFYACDAHCMICGELTNENATHTIVHVEAKAPTCTEFGNVEYWYCSDCGYAWMDANCTVQANQMSVRIGATCATNAIHSEGVEAGCHYTGRLENWYCANCDVFYLDAECTIVTNYKSLTVPALKDSAEYVPAKAPTCTENGNVEYWVCYDCEQVWANEALTQLTNIKNVQLGATCATNAIHSEGVEAGCHYTGRLENWYCANCDVFYLDAECTIVTNYKSLTVPALKDSAEYVPAKAPTCTENGNVEYWVCYDCEQVWANEALTQLTNIKNVQVAPTCATGVIHTEGIAPGCHYTGWTENWYCPTCDVYYLDAACTIVTNYKNLTIPALQDTAEHVDAKEATCYENGNVEYWVCYECEQVWADEALTQLTNIKNVQKGMTHLEATHVEAKAPTCYENGNIEYWYCEACGQAWLDADCTLNTNLKAVVLPMAHAEATHVEAKAPTCYENGNIEHWYCAECGQAWLDADCTLNTNLKAVVLPMAHAEATHVEAKAPTTTENGNIEYWYCEECGQAWLDADCTLNTNLKAVVLPMIVEDAPVDTPDETPDETPGEPVVELNFFQKIWLAILNFFKKLFGLI